MSNEKALQQLVVSARQLAEKWTEFARMHEDLQRDSPTGTFSHKDKADTLLLCAEDLLAVLPPHLPGD